MTEKQWNVISLGAGVQSSTMALMAARGLITPMPDAAIFADTQDEPASVYRWLDWLEKQLPFPVNRVTRGRLSTAALEMRISKAGVKYPVVTVPVFSLSASGDKGKIQHRACTADYKITPIVRHLRKLCGVKRGQSVVTVTSWIGISLDEVQRMKPSREPWVKHRWPLVEMRKTRRHCLEWMAEHGYPTPPRSSCVYCPFRNDAEWRRLKNDEPEEFAKAVHFERELQVAKSSIFGSTPFLHRSCVPLDQIDFRNDIDHGQQLLWQDECEGMCGV